MKKTERIRRERIETKTKSPVAANSTRSVELNRKREREREKYSAKNEIQRSEKIKRANEQPRGTKEFKDGVDETKERKRETLFNAGIWIR